MYIWIQGDYEHQYHTPGDSAHTHSQALDAGYYQYFDYGLESLCKSKQVNMGEVETRDIVMLEGSGVLENIGALGDTGALEDVWMLWDVGVLVDIQVLEQEDNLKLEEEILWPAVAKVLNTVCPFRYM